MRVKVAVFIAGVTLWLSGCAKTNPPVQSATVNLKDGTTFSGTVSKSDNSAITVQAPTGETRTFPMTQVDTVNYTAPTAPNAASGTAPNAPAPPPEPPVRTIAAGTTIRVRNSGSINARTASSGETFPAMITQDVIGDDGAVAIPKGSDATLVVRSVRAQGKVKGQSMLAIDLDSVVVAGKTYNLDTSDVVEHGKQGLGKNRRSAKFIGGGAVLGTVIGAVAGGGVGAAIGAGAGAGAGAGLQALTRGKNVRIPAESILSFRMEAPVHIQPAQ